jgi:hypothetical protein
MIDTLTAAVAGRQILVFEYDGMTRIVEPHAVGRTRAGKLVFRGFQPHGETQRGLGWKLFSADKVLNLEVADATFPGPRDGYRMGDKQIAEILAQLEVANEA